MRVCSGFRHAAWMPKNVFMHYIPPRGPYALLCGAEKLEDFMTFVFCTVTAGPCGWRGTPHTHSPGAPATSEEGVTPFQLQHFSQTASSRAPPFLFLR